jgi:isoleucyl-tRNA synthetase
MALRSIIRKFWWAARNIWWPSRWSTLPEARRRGWLRLPDVCEGPILNGAKARHPMAERFPDSEFFTKLRPLLAGDFVTTDSGTGFVHMAPDHGEDDFLLCKANKINPVFAEGDGKYRADWPWLGGEGSVINPNSTRPMARSAPPCARRLRLARRACGGQRDYKHSYPHSWRSKAKVIFRCTPQWFVPMDKDLAPLSEAEDMSIWPRSFRRHAARGAGDCRHPLRARKGAQPHWRHGRRPPGLGALAPARLGRADHAVRRSQSGEYLVDPAVNAASSPRSAKKAWMCGKMRAQEYLGPDYDAEDYERVTDILDVWFDPAAPMPLCWKAAAGPIFAPRRLSGRPLSRRQRPASRLVPVLAAGKLRHARPCPTRRC